MKLRPCIDLHEGKVKQIVGETLEDGITKENFTSSKDAAYYANYYKKKSLMGGHVIMLGKGNEEEAKKALEAFPRGLQIGGGIDESNCQEYLNAGASHIIVTSYIFRNNELDLNRLETISQKAGRSRLVIDLSCKRNGDSYFVATNRWRDITEFEINENNLNLIGEYCDELLIHASDVEGKRQGPDLNLVSLLGEISPKRTTYAGGISCKEDISSIFRAGSDRIDITIGSALDIFGGDLSMEEILKMPEIQT